MKQNLAFNFTQDTPQKNLDVDFKKQRAAYLAQRNARKRQAQIILKRQRGHSTSSDDSSPSPKKPVKTLQFQQKKDETFFNISTNIKTQETNVLQFQDPNQQNEYLRKQRQLYRAQRAAHKQEVSKIKQFQFGCSSSDEDSLPVEKTPNILEVPSKLKEKSLSNNSSSDYESSLFNSVQLDINAKAKNFLNQSARLRIDGKQKRFRRQRFEIEVPSKKGINIWLQKVLQFKDQTIQIGDRNVPIYEVNKVKLFFVKTASGNYKMKICYKDQDIFFAVDHKKLTQQCLDHYYYLFAKITMLKLQLMGKKPQSENTKAHLSLSQSQLKGAQLTGKVRKSSFFGGWQPTIGVINQSGLSVYKQGKEKPALIINYNTIRQIWTRFDFDSDNLILKFLHNSSKVELSIPLQDYLSRDNWLYHIYNLACK